MTKTGLIAAGMTALALLAAPGVGDAQSRGSSANAPISFGANHGEYVGDTVTLEGAAELIQGQNRFRADRISGLNTQGGDSRIEARGNVYFVTPDQTIRGDNAVYTTANDTIVVTGDVILTQGQNVLTGSRLTYNTRTESARIEGGSGQGGRIRGVFYPQNSGN
ncbi:MAG: LPS ABC transporter substrate-binding protein LptA [Brevundimonas sp.]|nr:MAG: LPS ABC transporter substrate-binding protein LptA [Brevundimonas sp.]